VTGRRKRLCPTADARVVNDALVEQHADFHGGRRATAA
jgi:hypothetical protein